MSTATIPLTTISANSEFTATSYESLIILYLLLTHYVILSQETWTHNQPHNLKQLARNKLDHLTIQQHHAEISLKTGHLESTGFRQAAVHLCRSIVIPID